MLDILSKKNILEGVRATDNDSIRQELNYAINNGYAVSLQYKQNAKLTQGQKRKGTSVRYVEPWGIGFDRRTGSENIRIYQVSGDSTSGKKRGFWKTLTLSSIINVIVLDGKDGTGETKIDTSFSYRPAFNANDAHIRFQNYVGKNHPTEEPQAPEERPQTPEEEPTVQVPQTQVVEPEQPTIQAPVSQTSEPEPEPRKKSTYGSETLAEQIKKMKKLIKY